MADEIRIHADILEKMIRHARQQPEIECCGLVAGRAGIISEIFPTSNALNSPTAYEIPPVELFQLFRRFRREGLQHLGHYHSHPRTDNFPSETDISQAYYPEQAYFIVSPVAGAVHPVRGFLICNGKVSELKIEIVG